MALENPIKKDLDKVAKDLEALQRLYNVYFGGGEEEPPTNQRRALDSLIAKIKAQVPSLTNSGDRFAANALTSKYQVYSSKWDKTLRAIEAGTIVLPRMRK
ncbi:MAG: hypothetical protein ACXWQO_09525 [Bdellovibrionota bacterium]